jgi:hypothetical protein
MPSSAVLPHHGQFQVFGAAAVLVKLAFYLINILQRFYITVHAHEKLAQCQEGRPYIQIFSLQPT